MMVVIVTLMWLQRG